MEILRNSNNDENEIKKAFDIFQQEADKDDFEACWRIAACLFKGIGTEKDKDKSHYYSKKAMDAGSLDGMFWYARASNYNERFPIYQEASKKGHLASKWWIDYCLYCGHGLDKDQEKARDQMASFVSSVNDGFWTAHHAAILQKGYFGFEQDETEAERLIELSKTQSISDCSVFVPGYW